MERETTMRYWLNIHDPTPISKNPDKYHANLWLQEKHQATVRHLIKMGEKAVIYETAGPQQREIIRGQSRATVMLCQGRKGIILAVKITKDFQEDRHLWDGIPFLGYFGGKKIKTRRNIIPLGELRGAWIQAGLPAFNPYINGGLRELSIQEWRIVSSLLGCEEDC
jgi:hypothetical protein